MKCKKKKYYIAIIIIIIILGGILAKGISANSQGKPEISIAIKDGYPTPNPAEVGEEIEVVYTITPEPINIESVNLKKDKEVIFVIDISESMYKCMEHDKYINVKLDEYEQCPYHTDESLRRLSIVKESLKALIETIKDVESLKVGIITYSYIGEVHQYNSSSLFELTNHDQYNNMINIIDGLSADGSTNTGDGLRQGAAILKNSSNKDAEKSIVFFTDGVPSRYTVDKNNQFETSLSGKATNIDKTVADTDTNKQSLEYAKVIGEKIKDEGYNVLSIACALTSNAINNIKEIHFAMGGTEEEIFLANDEETLKKIFDNIGDKIKEQFEIKEVKLNLKEHADIKYSFSDYLIEEEQGNILVPLNNIIYRLNEERNLYISDPFEMVFKVISNKEGTIIINEDSYLSYEDIYFNIIKKEVPTVKLNLIDKNTPYIDAELISEKYVDVYENGHEEMLVEYKITPQDIKSKLAGEEDGVIEEVIFLLDSSVKMTIGNRYSQIQNGIVNSIVRNSSFKNTKFGVITYSDVVLVGDRSEFNNGGDVSMKDTNETSELIQPLFAMDNEDSKDKFRQLFQNNKIIMGNSTERNIDTALLLASSIYKEFGERDKSKAIVILASGDVNYSSKVLDEIREQEIKIVTLDISDEDNSNIEELHREIDGDTNNYLTGTINGGNYNSVDKDMAEVAKRLMKVDKKVVFSTISSKLNFDFNSNFIYVTGSDSENVEEVILEDSKLVIKLSPIVYQYKERVNDEYNIYSAESFNISFKIKVTDGKTGQLKFGENNEEQNSICNYIIYNKFNKNEFVKAISTPVINVLEEYYKIEHGLYNGIREDIIYIDEEEREFLAGANVNFGAVFNVKRDSRVTLSLDRKGILANIPTVYEFSNGSLNELGKMTKDNGEFYYNIHNYSEEKNILILYSYTVIYDDINRYENKITIGNTSKKASLRAVNSGEEETINSNLPNLF